MNLLKKISTKIKEINLNSSQINEVRIGRKKGLDVSIYADPKFDSEQMFNIRLGLESNVDVSVYADPKFDSLQMSEILYGLERNVDVSIYADPKFDNQQMFNIRYGLEKGLDVSIYADSKFDMFQMSNIRLGLEKGLDVSVYADPKFDSLQMSEILYGLENNVDISIYADPKFEFSQMSNIRLGLEKGLDVSIYADPKFDMLQMEQIRLGLENDVDVSVYADPKFDYEQMEQIRIGLEKELKFSNKYENVLNDYNEFISQFKVIKPEKYEDIMQNINIPINFLKVASARDGFTMEKFSDGIADQMYWSINAIRNNENFYDDISSFMNSYKFYPPLWVLTRLIGGILACDYCKVNYDEQNLINIAMNAAYTRPYIEYIINEYKKIRNLMSFNNPLDLENNSKNQLNIKSISQSYESDSKEIFIDNLTKLKNVASSDADKKIINTMSTNGQEGTHHICALNIIDILKLLKAIGFNEDTIIDSIYNLNEDSYAAVTTYLFLLFEECINVFKDHPKYPEIIATYTNNLGNYLNRECGKLEFINKLHDMQRTIGVSDMFFDELIEYFSKNRNSILSILENEINK